MHVTGLYALSKYGAKCVESVVSTRLSNFANKNMYLLCGLIGAFMGARQAKKRNGTRADIAQYAAGYGIFFALIGLVITVILDRSVI